MGVFSGPEINEDGLVLVLDAANQKSWGGGGTWKDTSGQGNDGTLTNGLTHSQGPFPGAGYVTFDGTGDYLNTTYTTSNFRWWDTDYTIEAWIYPSSLNTGGWYSGGTPASTLVGNGQVSGGANSWSFGPYNSSGNIKFYYYNGSSQHGMVSTETVNLNEWNHIAFIKNSSGCKIFVNGVGTDYMAISGTPQDNTGHDFFIGRWNSTNITGYVSNLRVVKGTALYTSNFTPPKESLENNSNTTLLTCQGSSISDASDNSLTVTANGDAAAVYNDVAYFDFDGTDDYVAETSSLSDAFWQGNWTASFWVNFDTLSTSGGGGTDKILIHHGSSSNQSGLHLVQRNLKILHGLYGDDLEGTNTVSAGTWYNVVFTLNNTSKLQQIYIDGILDSSRTASGAYTGSGTNTRIGGKVFTFGSTFDGSMGSCSFYNRVLTAAEVKQNFNALRGRYGI
jgi:hypothetical protein